MPVEEIGILHLGFWHVSLGVGSLYFEPLSHLMCSALIDPAYVSVLGYGFRRAAKKWKPNPLVMVVSVSSFLSNAQVSGQTANCSWTTNEHIEMKLKVPLCMPQMFSNTAFVGTRNFQPSMQSHERKNLRLNLAGG